MTIVEPYIKRPPSGYRQSHRLMEVGRSINVRQKLAESLEETSLYFEKKKKNTQREKHSWSTIGRHLLYRPAFSFILFLKCSKTMSASSTWQPRNTLVKRREWENSRWDGQKVAALTLRVISMKFLLKISML